MKKLQIPLVVKVLIAIVLGIVCGQFFPGWAIRTGNTFSAVFNQLLRFFIPLIIIGLVTPAIADFGRRAGKMLLITVGLAYLFTVGPFPHVLNKGALSALENAGQDFTPFFTVEIPPVADVMTALVLSFLLGIGIAVTGSRKLLSAFAEFKNIIVL